MGASTTDGPERPIRIQAQALRDLQAGAGSGTPGFVSMDDESERVCADDSPARPSQVDLERAIAAAEKAGLSSYRVEMGPDGTITIVVGEPREAPE